MSSTYEYRRLAVKLPAIEDPDGYPSDPTYMLFVESGASNSTMFVTDRHGREREVLDRSWHLGMVDTHTGIIEKACKVAAFCESGRTRGYKGRELTPEGYIKACRSTLANALEGDEAVELLAGARVLLSVLDETFLAFPHLKASGRLLDSSSACYRHELTLADNLDDLAKDAVALTAVVAQEEWAWLGVYSFSDRLSYAAKNIATRKRIAALGVVLSQGTSLSI